MNASRIKSFLLICIGFTFIVPLVVLPNSFIFPFIVPKILLFRSLVLLMAAGYVALLTVGWREFRPRMTPITIAVLLFGLSLTLSTFFGVDAYRSMWDNHERMLGLFTLLHYVLYYVVATTVIRDDRTWERLGAWFLFAGSLVMLIAVIQKGNPDFLLNRGADRVSSTLGNPIYLGGYGLFILYLGLLLAWRAKKASWQQWLRYGGAALGFLGIFLSGTRGSFVGLCAGVFVFVVIAAIHFWREPAIRRVTIVAIVLAVTTFGFLIAFRTHPVVRSIPALGVLLNTELRGDSVGTRILAWSVAIESAKDYPLFGWGPNNYYYAFNQHFRPESLEYGWAETWFDNAHNIFLNTLSAQGIFGLLIYLALFATAIVVVVKRYKQGSVPFIMMGLSIAFLGAHVVQNIFVFENPTSYLYFFFTLAFMNGYGMKYGEMRQDAHSGKISIGMAGAVAGLMFLFLYATNVNPARANMAMLHAIQNTYQGEDPIIQYEKVTAIPTPHIDDIRNDFSRTMLDIAPQYKTAGREADAQRGIEFAFKELEKNRELHPLDIRVHIQQAEQAQFLLLSTNDPAWLLAGEKILEDARRYSPSRQQLVYMLAPVKATLGKVDEAVALLQHTIDEDPKIAEGWWRLAFVREQGGNHAEALRVLVEAEGKGIVFTGSGAEVVRYIRSVTSTVSTTTVKGKK